VSSEADVPMTDPETGTRWSRREMLKKSAVAGGVALWAIPAVEVIGTKVAAASTIGVIDCTVYPDSNINTLVGATVSITYNLGSTTGLTDSFTVTTSSSGSVGANSGSTGTLTASYNTEGNPAYLSIDTTTSDVITYLSVQIDGSTVYTLSSKQQTCSPLYIVPGPQPL